MTVGLAGILVSVAIAVAGDLVQGSYSFLLIGLSLFAAGGGLFFAIRGTQEDVGGASAPEETAAVLRIKAEMTRQLEESGADSRPIDPPIREIPEHERVLAVDLESVPGGPELSSRTFISSLCDAWTTTDDARCTLLLGAPGSGKTRLLYELTRTMADAHLENPTRQIPIFLRTHGWDPEQTSVRQWLTSQCVADYRISPRITNRWLRNRMVLLIIDGLDELPSAAREAGMDALKVWVRSAQGSRVLLSSRISHWRLWGRWLDPDRVAVLGSLPISLVEECLRSALNEAELVRENIDLDRLVEAITVGGSELSRPAVLQLIIDSLSLPHLRTLGDESDEGRAAFLSGVRHCESGDTARAKLAFNHALECLNSPWRSPAAVHLSLLLNEQGDAGPAEELLRKSLSWRLQQSLEDAMEHRRAAPLSDLERQVLAAMEEGVSYDVGQVGAQSRLSISVVRQSLRSLREKGLIESFDDSDGYARFRKLLGASAVGWQ